MGLWELDPLKLYLPCSNDGTYEQFWKDTDTVYFLGEWNMITFYANGSIVSMDALAKGEVVQQPAQNEIEFYLWPGQSFVGWDIDGDGIADDIPMQLSSEIKAVAIIESKASALGDVTGDGEVDANDLTALSRHVARIEEFTDSNILKAADVTGDGEVDANDLTVLSRYVARIINSFD